MCYAFTPPAIMPSMICFSKTATKIMIGSKMIHVRKIRPTHDQLCEQVLGYIRENYQNNNLRFHEIAHFANVSPTYLSALFKKNMAVTISNTITATRTEAACGVLRQREFLHVYHFLLEFLLRIYEMIRFVFSVGGWSAYGH